MQGYIQVYTGEGKGKTTAALGLALRAVGAGKKVFIAQFVKGQICSEIKAIQKFYPDMVIKQYGSQDFITGLPDEDHINSATKGLNQISEILNSEYYDVVILDEANIALSCNLFTTDQLLQIIKRKPGKMEIIITGRYAPLELVEIADLVTEMNEVKHYYKKGVKARAGIEF